MEKDWRRPHVLFILSNLRRFTPLLLAPLARGVMAAACSRSLTGFFKGAGFDLWIAATMIMLSAADYYSFRYKPAELGVEYARGVWIRRRGLIPRGAVWHMERPLFYRVLGAALLRADTRVGRRRGDFTLVCSPAEAEGLMGKTEAAGHRPTAAEVALMAFITSNAPAGVLIMFTTVRGLGSILGRSFERQLWGGFWRLPVFGLPPVAAAAGYLLLTGWALALGAGFLKLWGFIAARENEHIFITSGLIGRECRRMRADTIIFMDIRRNISCVLLRLRTLLILSPGMKGTGSVLIPAAQERQAERVTQVLLPELCPDMPMLRPTKRAWLRYYSAPVLQLVGITVAARAISLLLPVLRDGAVYLGAMAALIPIWRLALTQAELKSAHIALSDGRVTLSYGKRLYLHHIVINSRGISEIKIRQSPIQRLGGSCDIALKTRAGKKSTLHLMRGYNYEEAAGLFGKPPLFKRQMHLKIKPVTFMLTAAGLWAIMSLA